MLFATTVSLYCESGSSPAEKLVGSVDGSTARVDGLTAQVVSFHDVWAPDPGMPGPGPGMKFLTIEVRLRNESDESWQYQFDQFLVRLSDGSEATNSPLRDPALHSGTLGPASTTVGWITFEVPTPLVGTHLVWIPFEGIILAVEVAGFPKCPSPC